MTLGTSVGSSGVVSSVPPPPGLLLLGVGARKPRSCESHPSKNGEGLPWDVLRARPGLSRARLQSHPVCRSPVRTPVPSSQHRAEGAPWQMAQPGLGVVCWLHSREQPQPLETLLQLTGTGSAGLPLRACGCAQQTDVVCRAGLFCTMQPLNS